MGCCIWWPPRPLGNLNIFPHLTFLTCTVFQNQFFNLWRFLKFRLICFFFSSIHLDNWCIQTPHVLETRPNRVLCVWVAMNPCKGCGCLCMRDCNNSAQPMHPSRTQKCMTERRWLEPPPTSVNDHPHERLFGGRALKTTGCCCTRLGLCQMKVKACSSPGSIDAQKWS